MADLTLAPPPYHTVLDTAGAPVPNACIWTYVAGTTTLVVTYGDALGTPNTNPIRADSAGRFTAYLVPGAAYLFVYEGPATPPAHGAVLRTADHIVGTPAAPALETGTWTPDLGGTATYTAREGTYVRAGALVFARGSLTVGVLGTGSAYQVDGLPFPVAGHTPGAVGLWANLAAPLTALGLYGYDGTTAMLLQGQATAVTSAGTPSVIQNGTALTLALTYRTLAP